MILLIGKLLGFMLKVEGCDMRLTKSMDLNTY